MYRDTLAVTHPTQVQARENYINTVSRILNHVDCRLRSLGHPPAHWVDLLLAPEFIRDFFQK